MTIYDFVRGLFDDAETYGVCEFMTEEEAAYNLEEYRKRDYEMPENIEPWELASYWNHFVRNHDQTVKVNHDDIFYIKRGLDEMIGVWDEKLRKEMSKDNPDQSYITDYKNMIETYEKVLEKVETNRTW